ncbi:hypothetical protein ACU686_31705 [Yinghuangia aomiensis]
MAADPGAGKPVVLVHSPAPARPAMTAAATRGVNAVKSLASHVHDKAATRQTRQILNADQRPQLTTSTTRAPAHERRAAARHRALGK